MRITDQPELYDLLYKDVTEDIPMYLKLLSNCQNILEFGCGTGRVTIPLAKAGHHVEAVDISKAMLACLSKKIKNTALSSMINPVIGNMCSYQAQHKYEAIIMPLTTFNYLITKKEQISCLKTIAHNLTNQGWAIIELLSPQTFCETNKNQGLQYIKDIIINETEYYKYYRQTKLNMKTRKISQQRLFKRYNKEQFIGEEMIEWSNRFVTVSDIQKLVAQTPLMIENIYGNCQLEPYHTASEDLFIVLRRKI